MAMQTMTVARIYIKAEPILPSWSMRTFCIENVENVVKPPQSPTVRSRSNEPSAESHHEETDYPVHHLYPFDIREIKHVSRQIEHWSEDEGIVLQVSVNQFQVTKIRRPEIT